MHSSKRSDPHFCQTIQDTVALHYLLPIRTLAHANKDAIFDYLNHARVLGRRFNDVEALCNTLDRLLQTLPNFFHEPPSPPTLPEAINRVKLRHIQELRKLLYATKSSFNPFFMAALDASLPVKTYKMLFYLKLLFTHAEENCLIETQFFQFHYHYFYIDGHLFLIGPIMSDRRFGSDERNLQYIKSLKRYFGLSLHTYELLNLLNQRDPYAIPLTLSKTKQLKKVLSLALQMNDSTPVTKHELRELAVHFIVSVKHRKSKHVIATPVHNTPFVNTLTQIRNNQIRRDLEALEWFNDFLFQNLSFDNGMEVEDTHILNYLRTMLQADGYILCNYTHYDHQLSLREAFFPGHETLVAEAGKQIVDFNQSAETLRESYTFEVIREYQEHKNPIQLLATSADSDKKFCLTNAESLLSIPLVFDKRVFGVLHFIGLTSGRFDAIDKRFLLKLSAPLSKRYIELHLNSCLDQTLPLVEELNRVIDQRFLKEKSDLICRNIARAFCSDGVIIWFNQKEVFQTPKEANELTILSELNFLDRDEIESKADYPIDLNTKESLLMKHAAKKLIIIDDIKNRCSSNPKDPFFMKYKEAFVRKGIETFMFVTIRNIDGKFSGAIMVYDKTPRRYTPPALRMLKRISTYIGSILNTVTYARYRTQHLDERNLHESAQYLNIIHDRARDLERTFERIHLPGGYDTDRLYLNIQDIKDFTGFTRTYLFTLFSGGKFVKKYDDLVAKQLREISQNTLYTPFRNALNQVLAVHKTRMHQSKDIFYKKHIQKDIEIKIPAQLLHDILSNLISNAIKYGQQSKYIRIWDEMHFNYYNIYIENIGYAIMPEERERIFERGVRGYITRTLLSEKREFGQTLSANKGIGLYIAKTLMKKGLGGNVVLEETTPFGKSGFNRHIFVIKFPKSTIRKRL